MAGCKNEPFSLRVYRAVQQIPRGRVCTYQAIAIAAKSPKAARAVGNALHRNPAPNVIPCHRVVKATGKLTASFAFGGLKAHRELLLREGIRFINEDTVDLERHMFRRKEEKT